MLLDFYLFIGLGVGGGLTGVCFVNLELFTSMCATLSDL